MGSCIYVNTHRYTHAGTHCIYHFFCLRKFVTVPHCIDYQTTNTHTSICGPVSPAVLFIAAGANPVSLPALGYPAVLVLIAMWRFSLSARALMILSTGLLCRRLTIPQFGVWDISPSIGSVSASLVGTLSSRNAVFLGAPFRKALDVWFHFCTCAYSTGDPWVQSIQQEITIY